MNVAKRLICILVAALMAMLPCVAFAQDYSDLVVLGNDLSQSQRDKVMVLLGVHDESAVNIITVNIDEEKALLGNLVDAKLIGSKSISCARVVFKNAGNGLNVSTYNITSITDVMYKSALLTAGVNDADVVVAAPTNVSGTAALAGIFKAYEMGTNTTLDDVAKAVASEELLLSGELADFIGSDEAVHLIAELKQMVLDNGWDNEETIRPAVVETLTKMNLSLTDDQTDQVVQLLLKFCSVDMDPEQIASQLQGIVKAVQSVAEGKTKLEALFDKAASTFSGIATWFKSIFNKGN